LPVPEDLQAVFKKRQEDLKSKSLLQANYRARNKASKNEDAAQPSSSSSHNEGVTSFSLSHYVFSIKIAL